MLQLWRKNCWCLEIAVFCFFIFWIILNLVSAVEITEIEINPAGTDSGNEWVELFSDEEISLEGFKLVNNDGDEFLLEGNFSGYYVVEFEKQWLDNTDEKVSLYQENDLIDKTEVFADSENNDKTWQLCTSWIFVSSTKGKKNTCEESETEEEEEDEDNNQDEEDEEEKEEKTEDKEVEETEEDLGKTETEEKQKDNEEKIENEAGVIKLGNRESQESKIIGNVLYESSSEKIKKYAIYIFSFLLIIIFIILLIKRSFKKADSF